MSALNSGRGHPATGSRRFPMMTRREYSNPGASAEAHDKQSRVEVYGALALWPLAVCDLIAGAALPGTYTIQRTMKTSSSLLLESRDPLDLALDAATTAALFFALPSTPRTESAR